MILFILRGVFLVSVAAVITLFVASKQYGFQEKSGLGFGAIVSIIGLALTIAVCVVAFDVASKQKRLSSVSGIFLGLLAGLLAAYALSFVVDLVGVYTAPVVEGQRPSISEVDYQALSANAKLQFEDRVQAYDAQATRVDAFHNLLRGIKVIIGLITCYIGISLVIQTKDDFRFVIPYVEFAREVRGNRPTLLDTSVIVDGRILDIVQTRLMQGTLIVPKFVLNELQLIADSGERIKRSRGRRGLDILQKLQSSDLIDVRIEERDAEGANVDQKLIALAQALRGRVMTNDFNLNKIATLRGVDVINLNDLAKALRPVVLPGEHMNVKLVKPGESGTQAVGYLEDGTMVVVEGGRGHLGQHVDLVVTSTLQTSAGRMIFGRFAQEGDEPGVAPPTADAAVDDRAMAADGPAGHSKAEETPPRPSEAGTPPPRLDPGGSAAGLPTGPGGRRPPSSRRNPRRS